MESYHSVLEKECLQRNEYENYQEAYENVTIYLLLYNQHRIHGSLYDLSPVEFFGKAFSLQRVKPFVIKV
ncbi:IS3 family transposase [Brevibacillus panacihumi]|uniref:IS3 family transposase n=1 Tax=Brevibacillus panacihumi TaxID=497735 RepID=UPI003D079B77